MKLTYIIDAHKMKVFYEDDNQQHHLKASSPLFVMDFGSKRHDVKTRKQRMAFVQRALEMSLEQGNKIYAEDAQVKGEN